MSLRYIIVATAPSMDGYASNVSPLILHHMKTTFEAQIPYAIIADTKLLQTAPSDMISAGIGDILGKYSCLCDWEFAHTITKEYYCPKISTMVLEAINTMLYPIKNGIYTNSSSIKDIMKALILSGIAMAFTGNSRPASGSEHHLSHYWEMHFLLQGKKPVLHGTKVGIATIATLKAYELLFQMDIDFIAARKKALSYSFEVWAHKMKEAYKTAAPSVISLEQKLHKNTPEQVISRIDLVEAQWRTLKDIAAKLPTADSIRKILKSLNAPTDPLSIGIEKDTFINSFLVAKELRNRYGLLQLIYDLGITESIAQQVWDYYYM